MTRHTTLLRRAAAACALLLVIAGRSPAQAAYDSPRGRVEVLGLRRWTLAMLRDSIRRYVPGQDLHDAACMVTLRDSLHFVDASVNVFHMAPPGQPERNFVSIKVIEPQEARRVQWDVRRRREYSSLLPDYAPLVLAVTDSDGGLWSGRILQWLQLSDSAGREAMFSRVPVGAQGGLRADAERVSAFLDAHRAEGDRVRAMRVLARDGAWTNRMVATAVLSNFPASDSTWWTLVRALRDPHEGVRVAAAAALGRMPSRRVDWSGAAADLRLLLNGTNLLAITDVFALLTRTEVAPELAPTLLRGNADWLLDHLGSEAPMAPDAARRLLVRLHGGQDLGRARAAWASWVRAL